MLYNLHLRLSWCFKYRFEIDSGKSYYLTKMARRCSSQLAKLQFRGLLSYSSTKFMIVTELCFQIHKEHYAYVTDGSLNWKTSSSYRSSGSCSSPSAKNVGNGGFLLCSLQVGNLLSLTFTRQFV